MMRIPARRGIPVLAAALLGVAIPAGAETKAGPGPTLSGRLSLEDAVKLAIVHNRDLERAVEERVAAKGRLWEAYGEAMPQVELEGTYARVSDRSGFVIDETTNQIVRFGLLENYSADLVVTQPIFQGGRAMAALRAARLLRAYADEQVRAAVQATVYAVTRSYYRALLLREQHGVATKYAALSAAHLKDVETKKRYGVASDFNVLRATVDLSNSRATEISFKNQLAIAMTELYRLLGASQDSAAELSEQLEARATEASEEDAVRDGLGRRTEVLTADLVRRLQREAVVDAKSAYFPKIEAFFRDTYAKPDPLIGGMNDWGNAWRAGLTFRFTIFDGLKREGRLIREKAALRQRELDLAESKERTRFEVRQAVLTLQDAAERVEVQKATLGQAHEGLRLADVGYREGTLDQVAVLDARGALTQAQLLYFTSLHDHAVARLELERARGTLGAPAEGTR